MTRSPMKPRTTRMKNSAKPMRRRALRRASSATMKRTRGLRPVSKKTAKSRRAFDAVYRQVDERSGGLCELTHRYDGIILLDDPPCLSMATEHHHTMKPRRSKANHVAERVIHLCPWHHDRCEGPNATFTKGRLVILPNGDGTFRSRYCYSKEEAQRWKGVQP